MSRTLEYYVDAGKVLLEDGFSTGKSIHIKDGIIADIPDSTIVPSGAVREDLRDCLISPFLCDYHLHFFVNSSGLNGTVNTLRKYGIAKVLEGGDKKFGVDRAREFKTVELDIKMAGCAIYKKDFYGKHIGMGVESVEEAKDLIDWLIYDGIEYVKVVNSGIFSPERGNITAGGFEYSELEEIAAYVKDKGIDMYCHANGDKAVRSAVESGATAIIHGLDVSDETLSIMSERGTSFIPTVNAFACLSEISSGPDAERHINEAVDKHLATIKRASEIGVNVLPGSDSGPRFIPYGKAYYGELNMFSRAGLSTEHIISAAASDHLKVGMKAEFVVLDGTRLVKVVSV